MRFPDLSRLPLDLLTLQNFLNLYSTQGNQRISIGGRLEGLNGGALELELEFNSSISNQSDREILVLREVGNFQFKASPNIGSKFKLGIRSQPTNGNQFCQINNQEGVIPSDGISSLLVQCGDPSLNRPNFTPIGGEYSNSLLISLSSLEFGSEIYYTIDGSTPNCDGNGNLYTTQIPLPQPTLPSITLSAINCKDEQFSFVQSQTYIITSGSLVPPQSLIAISPPNYSTQQSIGLEYPLGTPVGVEIRYTLDGSIPNCNSTFYSSPILISSSTTIRAISCLAGWTSSSIVDFPYTITGTMEDPIISPNGGLFSNETLVTISSIGSNSIYYRIDGIPPDCSGSTGNNLYSPGGFLLTPDNSSMTVQAIACSTPAGTTSVVSANFSFQASTPVLKVATEEFSSTVASLPPTTFLIDSPLSPFTVCYSTTGNAECSTTNGGSPSSSGGFCAAGSLISPVEGIAITNSGLLSLRACRENYLGSTLKTINLSIQNPLVTFQPRIFVTNSIQTGGYNLEQADEICNTDSNRPYKGNEITWEVLRQGGGRLNNLRWVLEPNTEYFNALGQSLQTTNAAGRGFNNPLNLNNPISTMSLEPWTGMNVNAMQNLILNPAATCNNWTSSTGGQLAVYGFANSSDSKFVISGMTPSLCNLERPYYCVERHPRKRVFVTNTNYSGNLGGKIGADEKCNLQTEINRPNSGTFKAMVMSVDRNLSMDWVFKPNRSYYANDRLTEILNTDPMGKIQNLPNILSSDLVWTGMNSVIEANTANCLSWTSDLNSEQAGLGKMDGFDPVNGIYQGEGSCDVLKPIVCVEQ